MVLVPIRSDNAYFAFTRQAAQGTAQAPTNFVRWLDGSSIELDIKGVEVLEGDGSRHLSYKFKGMQNAKIKLTCMPRPVEAGLIEQMIQGANGDSLALTASGITTTTTTAPITGGTTTSVGLTSATGYATTGKIQLVFDPGLATQEVVLGTIATLTFTVDASYNTGKFAQSHASGANVQNVAAVDTMIATTGAAGVTTVILSSNVGLTGAGTAVIAASVGTANEEYVAVTTPGSGAGPYTYTLANGATTKFAHTANDLAISPVTHTITDQTDGDYWTFEVGIGSLNGQGGMTLRVRDCKGCTLKRSSKAGDYLKFDLEVEGLVTVLQGSPSTVVLEKHQPYLFTSSNGGWTIDGATTGDAPYVEEFTISQNNNCDLIQTEQVTGSAMIFGKLVLTVEAKVAFQATSVEVAKTYFGGAAGTTDVQAAFLGALIVLFTNSDGFSSLSYNVPTLFYDKAPVPTPKGDGKHYVQDFSATAFSNQGQNTALLTTVAVNSRATGYNQP